MTPAKIPQELKDLHQWVCYRLVPKPDGGFDKWPINPGYTGKMASTTDPTTWSRFEHAAKVAKTHPFLAGIGFVFADSDPYCGADFDDCVDEGGEIDPWVVAWLERLGGYQEISQSGTGVHAIVKAWLPGGGKKRVVEGHKVEIYDRHRFFATTGHEIGGEPEEAQAAVEDLYRRMDPPPEVARQIRRLRSPVLADDELLGKARTAANGYKFRHLFDEGEWRKLKYPSQSEADLALVSMLIFWTGGDRDQVLEIFEASALYRPPGVKGGGYVERTVDGALAGYRGSYYDPKHRSEGVRDELRPYFALADDATVWKGGRRPAARKVLLGMLLVASEHGTRNEKGVGFGVDMRTLSEVSHVSLGTLCQRSLPLLAKERVVRWSGKEGGRRASRFLLPLPGVWASNTRSSHAYSVRPSHTLGEPERKELLRASMGRSPFAEIARIGNAKQTILEVLVGTPRASLSVSNLAEITGRRRPDVRRNMRELDGLNLAVEVSDDHYALPPDFWDRWGDALEASGVVHSETRKRKRHQEERLFRAGWQPAPGGLRETERWVSQETGEVLDREAAVARAGGSA
jgi:hypothetical protein